MTVNQMRKHIGVVYDSSKWRNRVALMPDNQVIAIYYNFLEKGKFDKPRRKKNGPRQLTIFDYDEKGQYVRNKRPNGVSSQTLSI